MADTQDDKVRRMLLHDWTCGTTMLALYIPRYAACVHRLRRLGYAVERRKCCNPSHRHLRDNQYEWRITPGTAQQPMLLDVPVRMRSLRGQR